MSTTQKAAIKAGLRTAEQTLFTGLGVVAGGGMILGATSIADINWLTLGGALIFLLITAFFAGLKSYLSFVINGVPAAYTATDPAPVATPDPAAAANADAAAAEAAEAK